MAESKSLYAAPNEATWGQMVTALSNIPASRAAHEMIINILNSVMQVSQQAKAQALAAAAAAPEVPPAAPSEET